MRKLNEISFLLIMLFMVECISLYNGTARLFIVFVTLFFAITYTLSKFSRKSSRKKMISGHGGGMRMSDIV